MKIIIAQWRKDIATSRVLFWIWVACVLAVVLIPRLPLDGFLSQAIKPESFDFAAGASIMALLTGLFGLFVIQLILALLLVAIVVHMDPLTNPHVYWRTRPISRPALLGAKSLYVGLLVVGLVLSYWSLGVNKGDPRGYFKLAMAVLGLMAFATVSANLVGLILNWVVTIVAASVGAHLVLRVLHSAGLYTESFIQQGLADTGFPWLSLLSAFGLIVAIVCQYLTFKTNVTRGILFATYFLPPILLNH